MMTKNMCGRPVSRKIAFALALLAVWVASGPGWAGGPEPPDRSELLNFCEPNSTCVAVDANGNLGCQSQCVQLTLLAPLISADLSVSVLDTPTCSSATVQISGRQKTGKGQLRRLPPLHGGRPFSLSLSFPQACNLLTLCAGGELFSCSNSHASLTEATLTDLSAHDLTFQRLPAAVETALMRELRLTAGTPIILAPQTFTPATGAHPTTVSATVTIAIIALPPP